MLWRPGTQPKSARLSPVGNEVIPAQCERVVMARLQAHLGGNQHPHQTQPEVFPRRSVYNQDASLSQAESTCPHHECDQRGPGAE
jgi:hypothetical protein